MNESKSVSVTAMSGSYTIVNSTLIVAFKLVDDNPNLEDLLTPISPSDMALLPVDEAKSHSAKESVPSSNNPEQNIVEDDEYYLSMVNFEFEDVQFLVPRWRFPESSMLGLPLEQDTCASTWDGISAQEFGHLMEFMYPFDSSPLSTRHWVSVLKLSSIWHMCDYRKQALLSHNFWDLEPEEKLVLGQLSGVPEWYQEGCIGLACGKSQLNASHEATIGIDAMVKIARARDAAYRDTVVLYHKQFPNLASFAHEVPDSFVAEDNPSMTGSSIVDNVCTARENGLYLLLRCCYERLIDREESITLEEVATLGLETTIGIWKARLGLFQAYWHILKPTQNLNFTTHIEAEFATELKQVGRLQDILGSAHGIDIIPTSISISLVDLFNPESLYVIINLKFNTVLGGSSANNVLGWEYDGRKSQTWKFERTDSYYRIANASTKLYLAEGGKSKRPLICSEEPSIFGVGRTRSDGPNIYGIFLPQFTESTATAVRMKSATDYVSLEKWEGDEMEGWKWKIVTVDEAKKHFGVA